MFTPLLDKALLYTMVMVCPHRFMGWKLVPGVAVYNILRPGSSKA